MNHIQGFEEETHICKILLDHFNHKISTILNDLPPISLGAQTAAFASYHYLHYQTLTRLQLQQSEQLD